MRLPATLLAATLGLLPAAAPAAPTLIEGVATAVGAGYDHSCALTAENTVRCWGYNAYGQLGDNSTTLRPLPVAVLGLGGPVVGLATGGAHNCALTPVGGVRCWGANYYGEVGDGTTFDRWSAVPVTGLASGVAAIAAGGSHSCALTAGGAVKCWGRNDSGQLGDGTTTHRPAPVAVTGLASGVVAIAAGGSHTCALTTAGAVLCWGGNASGQLGDGTTTMRLAPVALPNLVSGVASIAVGENHSCAIGAASGSLSCWGNNASGQLGDGTTTSRTRPTKVDGVTNGAAVVAPGGLHTCALSRSGSAYCWGYNANGQLGDTTTTPRLSPWEIFALNAGTASLASGFLHACSLSTVGGVRCWGYGDHGNLGDGFTLQRNYPVDVAGFASRVAEVAAGGNHACALSAAGGVKCWGQGASGQVGDGTLANRNVPTDVTDLPARTLYLRSGYQFNCAITAEGTVRCWGRNTSGQLGDGTNTDRSRPVDVQGIATAATGLGAGLEHACAVTAGGGVKCWGWNGTAALGNGTTTNSTVAVDVTGLQANVHSVAPGWGYTCALTIFGGVKCWGANDYGMLGGSPLLTALTPVDVPSLTGGVRAIASGFLHTCALTTAGGVKCWGSNAKGQLGNGSTTNSPVPVDVTGLTSGVVAIGAGLEHTCAVVANGAVKCWGDNAAGQLGDGTKAQRNAPVDVPGLLGVAKLAPGSTFTCALTAEGLVRCWGANTLGELGDGTNVERLAPSRVREGQAVAIVTPATLTAGTSVATSPGAWSGLPVALASGTPETCTTSGHVVVPLAPGLCRLRASAPGNGLYAATPLVTRVIPVAAGCPLDAGGDCDGDGIPNEVETAEGRDPRAKDNDVFASARLFAMQQYRDFLGREGDAAGIAGWTGFLDAGTYSRAQVIDAFVNSPEFGGALGPVVRLYFGTFLRVPDYAGLMGNAALVRAGTVTLTQLADFFAASPEFAATYGALNNAQFVTLLYQNVLGRAPDAAGLNGWVVTLAGGATRGSVLLGFTESPEYQAALAHEVLATMMYAGMLRRSPEPAGFAGWVAALDAGTWSRVQVIQGFLGAAEYRARFLP